MAELLVTDCYWRLLEGWHRVNGGRRGASGRHTLFSHDRNERFAAANLGGERPARELRMRQNDFSIFGGQIVFRSVPDPIVGVFTGCAPAQVLRPAVVKAFTVQVATLAPGWPRPDKRLEHQRVNEHSSERATVPKFHFKVGLGVFLLVMNPRF